MSDQNVSPQVPVGFETVDLGKINDPITQMQNDLQQREIHIQQENQKTNVFMKLPLQSTMSD